jgi:hypothetical protein
MVNWRNFHKQRSGQVAQLVERSPEKAGVGGSIPSLATSFNDLQARLIEFGCIWLHFSHTLLHYFCFHGMIHKRC